MRNKIPTLHGRYNLLIYTVKHLNNCVCVCVFVFSVTVNSIATNVFTAHTVLQGSQQGNDTSIQHVSIVVETHQVAVEHPAELQPQSAHSGSMTTTCTTITIQPDQCVCMIILELPFLCQCTSPPFVSFQSCNRHINDF